LQSVTVALEHSHACTRREPRLAAAANHYRSFSSFWIQPVHQGVCLSPGEPAVPRQAAAKSSVFTRHVWNSYGIRNFQRSNISNSFIINDYHIKRQNKKILAGGFSNLKERGVEATRSTRPEIDSAAEKSAGKERSNI
jgi:hypothetical protein